MNFVSFFVIFVHFFFNFDTVTCKCGKEVKLFFKCYGDAVQDLYLQNFKRMEFDEFENKISTCFSSNGCSAIKVESESEIKNRTVYVVDDPGVPKVVNETANRTKSILHDDKAPTKNNSANRTKSLSRDPPHVEVIDKSKYKDCQKKIRQTMRSNVEKCLQANFDDDFEFPEEKETDYPKEYITRSGYAQEIWARSVYQKIYTEKICPSDLHAGKKVVSCVQNVFDEISNVKTNCKNAFDTVAAQDDRQRTLCEAGCFDKIKGDCSHAARSSFPTGCKCSREDYKKNSEKYKADFTECLGPVSNTTATNAVKGALNQLDRFACRAAPQDPCNNVLQKMPK